MAQRSCYSNVRISFLSSSWCHRRPSSDSFLTETELKLWVTVRKIYRNCFERKLCHKMFGKNKKNRGKLHQFMWEFLQLLLEIWKTSLEIPFASSHGPVRNHLKQVFIKGAGTPLSCHLTGLNLWEACAAEVGRKAFIKAAMSQMKENAVLSWRKFKSKHTLLNYGSKAWVKAERIGIGKCQSEKYVSWLKQSYIPKDFQTLSSEHFYSLLSCS